MLNFLPKIKWRPKKKVILFADAQFWDMKILGGMLPDYWGEYIPPWICTHGYEEVRNYRKTLFIQSIVENGWREGCIPHIPPPLDPPLAKDNVIFNFVVFAQNSQRFCSKVFETRLISFLYEHDFIILNNRLAVVRCKTTAVIVVRDVFECLDLNNYDALLSVKAGFIVILTTDCSAISLCIKKWK